jgi:CHAD domain-containing protein
VAKQSEIRGLEPDDGARAAAVKIVWTLFEDMWRLRGDVLEDKDIEAVHDMRVASRRLRTAMQTFRPVFPQKRARRHERAIKSLADALGEVRDRDVLLAELRADLARLPRREQAGLRGLIDRLAHEREAHHQTLLATIKKLDKRAYDRAFLAYFGRRLD